MTGPAHAHRAPMGALPAPHGSSQPGPDLDVRADGPSRVDPTAPPNGPETPAATIRRAVQRLRAIGMVTDALEGTGRIHPQDRFIGAVYAAVADVLGQAAQPWDAHGRLNCDCGRVGAICGCDGPALALARAVLGEGPPEVSCD